MDALIILSKDDWNTLKSPACCKTSPDVDNCDWTTYLTTKNKIDYVGDNTKCGKILNDVINATGLYNIDPYNYYQSCYAGSHVTYFGKPRRADYLKWKAMKEVSQSYVHNTADVMNRNSTDPLWGYPCYQEDYVASYFNKPEVQDAFNIDPAWRKAGKIFGDCNNDLYNQYILTYDDTTQFFDTMFKNLKNFRILIYNGDVDTVCNYLGDAKFIDKIATAHGFAHSKRIRWFFRKQVAGFYQIYTSGVDTNISITVTSVKGAGHFVPLDRVCLNCGSYGHCLIDAPDGNCSECACPEGYSGACCNSGPVPGCSLNSCNGTEGQHFVCEDLINGKWQCVCEEGWTGENCDEEKNGCDPNPCYNEEWCEQKDGGNFTCHCKDGYTGDYCQTYIYCDEWWANCGCDEDDEDQCSGNGMCIERGKNRHDCLCNQNYTGDNCENEPCAGYDCYNGGFCVLNSDGNPECECLSIWTGERCDVFNECGYFECLNGATCLLNETGGAYCECVTGYEGLHCENITDNCSPNPCRYTNFTRTYVAPCKSEIGYFICDCPAGTTGNDCSESINDCIVNGINPCNSTDDKANCTDGLNMYMCFCGPDYVGAHCEMSKIVAEVLELLGGGESIVDLLEEVVKQPSLIKDILPFLLGQMSKENQSMMSWDYDDLFVWAAYEKTELDIRKDIYKWFDTTLGNCFTFNHANSSKNYKLRRGGLEGGFRTLMKIRQDQYLQWYDTAALLVFLHPQDETVFAESLRYQVAPENSIEFRTTKVTYTRLGGKYGSCVNDKSEVTSYYYDGEYTTAGCLRACYQDAVEQACGCQDPRYSMAPDVPPCGIDAWDCVNNVTVVKGDASNWETCVCPSPCKESQFESAWSLASFIEEDIRCEYVKQTEGDVAYNYCMGNYTDMAYIDVYIPKVSLRVFQETPKMSFNQFVSYVGGLAGVFIGLCIITIIEFIFLIVLLVRALCFGSKEKSQSKKN